MSFTFERSPDLKDPLDGWKTGRLVFRFVPALSVGAPTTSLHEEEENLPPSLSSSSLPARESNSASPGKLRPPKPRFGEQLLLVFIFRTSVSTETPFATPSSCANNLLLELPVKAFSPDSATPLFRLPSRFPHLLPRDSRPSRTLLPFL